MRVCSVEGCDRPHLARGWCSAHYQRWKKTGETPAGPVFVMPLPADRLMSNVRIGPRSTARPELGSCWLWTGHTSSEGRYGSIRFAGKERPAHRAMYMALVGPIRNDRDLDHLCRVTLCVNPDHLEMVTHKENVLRGESPHARHARKTHCLRGHEFNDENTYVNPSGHRSCRVCRRLLRAVVATGERRPTKNGGTAQVWRAKSETGQVAA